MKAMLPEVSAGLFITVLAMALAVNPVKAQAPEGPQGSQQPQQGAPPPQQQAPAPPQQKPQDAGASIAVEVPVVMLDVIAATNHGDLLTGLKKENFRVIDNGVPQTITSFGSTDAPITIVVVMEFSARAYGWFSYYAKYWADGPVAHLKQKDWGALANFDIQPR